MCMRSLWDLQVWNRKKDGPKDESRHKETGIKAREKVSRGYVFLPFPSPFVFVFA